MKFLLRERRIDMRTLSHLKLASIGEGTASIMETYGWYADLIPDRYDGVRLLASGRKGESREKVLIARAAQEISAFRGTDARRTGADYRTPRSTRLKKSVTIY